MNTPKRRAAKFQKGNVILRSKIFYIRFYRNGKRVTEVLRLANREPLRCDKTFKTTTSKTVLQIAADHMKPINEATEHAQLNQHGVKVEDFFTSVYVPWTQANLRATTAMAYKKVWELYLAKHMTNRTLDEYRTHDASAVLTSLAKRGLGHAVIGHVRALGCGIFQHAVNLGNLDLNPWRGVKCLAKIKDRQGTHAYTKEE